MFIDTIVAIGDNIIEAISKSRITDRLHPRDASKSKKMELLTAIRECTRKAKKMKEDLMAKDSPTHLFMCDTNGQFIGLSRLSVGGELL